MSFATQEKPLKKRKMPPILQKILATDIYITDQFVKFAEKILALRQLKTHSKLLEVSGHGLLWFPCWIAFIWILNNKNLYQMQVNFFIGLILDVIIVALLKAITRRRRPVKSDISEIGPDKFSFPSGHASRALFITNFFLYIWPVHFVFVPPLLCWSVCLCLSRILLRRHHLLDIIAGVLLGVVEACFIGLIYLENETCSDIVWWITDEKLEGGEYHV